MKFTHPCIALPIIKEKALKKKSENERTKVYNMKEISDNVIVLNSILSRCVHIQKRKKNTYGQNEDVFSSLAII